jgi:hypothetical protein
MIWVMYDGRQQWAVPTVPTLIKVLVVVRYKDVSNIVVWYHYTSRSVRIEESGSTLKHPRYFITRGVVILHKKVTKYGQS